VKISMNRWDEQADVVNWAQREKMLRRVRIVFLVLFFVGLFAFTAGIVLGSFAVSGYVDQVLRTPKSTVK
jgi:hypothetical protein